MRNRVWRRAVFGILAAGMVLGSCSVARAFSGGVYPKTRQYAGEAAADAAFLRRSSAASSVGGELGAESLAQMLEKEPEAERLARVPAEEPEAESLARVPAKEPGAESLARVPAKEPEAQSLAQMLAKAKEQEAAVTGEDPKTMPDSRFIVGSRTENDIRVTSGADQCLTGGTDQVFYAIGKNYMPEGSALPVMFGQELEYSCTLETETACRGDRYYLVRFAVRLVNADGGQAGGGETSGDAASGGAAPGAAPADGELLARRHWNEGDAVIRTLDGAAYRFHCIDPDYGDGGAAGRSLALFLCDSVIPANTGSGYVYEQLADGSFGFAFYPGPIVNFGKSQEYADSSVRSWLKSLEEEADGFPAVNVGVERSYLGQTAAGSFGQFDGSLLRAYRMGAQLLTDHYFILSVEEALRYQRYLWRIDGMDEEETAASAGAFAKGYWLRTPCGAGDGVDSGCVYVVDLVSGNIHPQAVAPQWEAAGESRQAEDEELAVTAPVGVRPAFVLKQEN